MEIAAVKEARMLQKRSFLLYLSTSFLAGIAKNAFFYYYIGMKKYDIFNKAMRKRIFGVAAFCLLYIALALRPLSTELHISPEWTESITRVQAGAADKDKIPFKLGQNMGFFTPEGKITNLVTYPFKASISDSYYASYSANNSSADFFLPDGEKAGTINESGFPFFDEDRIYIFLPGGSSFAQCSSSGARQWIYESYCPITAFSSSKGGTVAGFADGTLVSFTKDGAVDQKFQPGGSNFSVILGAGISESGDTIACVCGQKQQRFVVAQKNGEHSKIIFHEYLEKDSVKQELVKFNRQGNVVYYGYEGGLGVVDLDKMESYKLPLNGHVVQIQENEDGSLAFVLSRYGKKYTITVIEKFNQSVATFSYNANYAFIQVRGNSLFVGRNDRISKLSVSRK